MAKVRWSRECAGGCGTWLPSGSRALHRFNNWFCADCVRRHPILRMNRGS